MHWYTCMHRTSSCCVILSVNRLISYICVLRGNHTGRVFHSRLRWGGTSRVFVPHELYAPRTEVPTDAIWRHRMQRNPLAIGVPPPDPAEGAYSPAQTLSWSGSPPQEHRPFSAVRVSIFRPSCARSVPLHLVQAGDAPLAWALHHSQSRDLIRREFDFELLKRRDHSQWLCAALFLVSVWHIIMVQLSLPVAYLGYHKGEPFNPPLLPSPPLRSRPP